MFNTLYYSLFSKPPMRCLRLAEAGVLTLSWYKTNEENAMLEYLKQNNVTTLQELKLWV